MPQLRRRNRTFAAVAVLCVLAIAGVVVSAVLAGGGATAGATRSIALPRPYLAYRSIDDRRGPSHLGEMSSTSVTRPGARHRASGHVCERLYASASDGICIARARSVLGTYDALLLGSDGQVRHRIALDGVPSRTRVSADGRYGATTTFVTGHSYAKPGSFSTATQLIDMRHGTVVGNLEDFTMSRAGRVVDAADVQYWGVTFARDSDHFYATMATGGRTFLVDAHVGSRTGRVIHDNVECPSLSPDGTRIAYKKLVGDTGSNWRFHVLDLATGRETPLAETRSVDDQLEWLDNGHLLYGEGKDVWTVPADGTGTPRVFLAHAGSPSVVR